MCFSSENKAIFNDLLRDHLNFLIKNDSPLLKDAASMLSFFEECH